MEAVYIHTLYIKWQTRNQPDSDLPQLKCVSNQSRIVKEPVTFYLGSYLTTETRKHLSPGSDCELHVLNTC